MSKLQYRPDIDGLRTIAVLSVIIFHINPAWLPSGFLGVDIFFVISGYLITKIISYEMQIGTFSFLEFYKRRAKRILPAFITVVTTTTILTSIIFIKEDFLNYLKSLGSSILFSTNLYFARNSDYFDVSSNEKPLMHIWSLSVEEQFYFVFPIILLISFKFFKDKIKYIILFLITISIFSYFLPSFGFDKYFLPHVRAYELLIGAFFAFIPTRNFQKSYIPNIAFIITILVMIIPPNSLIGYGYIEQILACLLVAILIINNNSTCSSSKLLSSKLFVSIGLISYSLYLWHWVILSIMRYIYMKPILPWHAIILSILLMFSFSILSYKFIEEPCRKIKQFTTKKFVFSIISYFSLIIPIISIYKYTNKIDSTSINLGWDHHNICHRTIQPANCTKGKPNILPTILMIGDSHTGQYNEFMDFLGKKEGWAIDIISSDSCNLIIFDNTQTKKQADKACLHAIEYSESLFKNKNYQTVIFASYWKARLDDIDYLKNFDLNIQKLSAMGKQIYVFKDNPATSLPILRKYHLETLGFKYDNKLNNNVEVELANQKIKQLVDKYPNVHWVDITSYIPQDFMINNLPIYKDNDHINPYGAKKLAEHFSEKEIFLKR